MLLTNPLSPLSAETENCRRDDPDPGLVFYAASNKSVRLSLTLGRKEKVSTNLSCCVVLLLFLPCGVGYIHQMSTQTSIIAVLYSICFLLFNFFSSCYLCIIFFFAPRKNLVHLIMDGLIAINLSLPL